MGVWGPVILDLIPYAPICAQFNSNLTQNRGIRRKLGDLQALFSPDEPLILCSGHIKHLQSKYLPNVCLVGLEGQCSLIFFRSSPIQFEFDTQLGNLTQSGGCTTPDEPLMLCSGHIKHLHSKYQLSVCLMGLVAQCSLIFFVRAQFNSNLMHSNCGI